MRKLGLVNPRFMFKFNSQAAICIDSEDKKPLVKEPNGKYDKYASVQTANKLKRSQ